MVGKNMDLTTLREISVCKTLRFNLHYFGLRRGWRLPVYVAKNMHLQRMEGTVEVHSFSHGSVRLGFGGVGIVSRRSDRGVWDNCGSVCFEGTAFLGVGTRLNNYGEMHFGADFSITAGAQLVCQSCMIFGREVLISWDTLIMDTDFHHILDENGNATNPPVPITVGNHVWIGCRCLLLKGVVLPDGAAVAAGTTLTHAFQEENILLGGCNRVLKTGIGWKK
jgi:acetyltransferase-like isoleucine patch superfamily enzyme